MGYYLGMFGVKNIMLDVHISETMFNRYSDKKQKEMLLELFSNIRDKGYFYEFGLTVYAREQKEKIIDLRRRLEK